MEYEIQNGPSYSVIQATLERGERIVSESGAMAWMDPGFEVKTGSRGGVLQGLKRKVLAGESFFQNEYLATQSGLRIHFAPHTAGDTCAYEMTGSELLLQRGAYVASTTEVHCDSKFDGLKGLFNEGLFVLRATGTGTLFFSSYGDIQRVDVDGDYVVDNGFAVAWEPSLTYRITKARRIRSFLFGDQILLAFQGRGKLWVQTRSPHAFANWIHPFRAVESSRK